MVSKLSFRIRVGIDSFATGNEISQHITQTKLIMLNGSLSGLSFLFLKKRRTRMVYQEYEITLSNGTILPAIWPYDATGKEPDLIEYFQESNDNEFVILGDPGFGITYVRRRDIISIRELGTKEDKEDTCRGNAGCH